MRKIATDRRRAVIAHEEIPGYMMAMTMEFDLGELGSTTELEAGDRLDFRLCVTDTRSWIDQIRKTGHLDLPAEIPATPLNSAGAMGAILPDIRLVDQAGRAFRLPDLHGKTVALTFIFTRCPLPNFCPLLSRHFDAVQRELATSAPLGGKWHLLSVSIDPEHDTPEVMAKYAASYEADPARWIFATGSVGEIRQLGAAVGLEFSGDGAQITHNLRTLVIDPAGRIQRVFQGNGWQPAELVAEMRRTMK